MQSGGSRDFCRGLWNAAGAANAWKFILSDPDPRSTAPGEADEREISNPAELRILLPRSNHVGQSGGEAGALNLAP